MAEAACRARSFCTPSISVRKDAEVASRSRPTRPTIGTARILEQAKRFHRLAPNIQVKIPVAAAGLAAMEEATYLGININATVQFTVAQQALAVGEAVESGLRRGRGVASTGHVARVQHYGGPARRLAACA